MRQYEKSDCVEVARENQQLKVGRANITANMGGEVDLVIVFGNPKTMNIVYVPFGSEVIIENKKYKVMKGEESEGSRYMKKDYSINCLLDNYSDLHSMYDFIDKDVVVSKLEKELVRKP